MYKEQTMFYKIWRRFMGQRKSPSSGLFLILMLISFLDALGERRGEIRCLTLLIRLAIAAVIGIVAAL